MTKCFLWKDGTITHVQRKFFYQYALKIHKAPTLKVLQERKRSRQCYTCMSFIDDVCSREDKAKKCQCFDGSRGG